MSQKEAMAHPRIGLIRLEKRNAQGELTEVVEQRFDEQGQPLPLVFERVGDATN